MSLSICRRGLWHRGSLCPFRVSVNSKRNASTAEERQNLAELEAMERTGKVEVVKRTVSPEKAKAVINRYMDVWPGQEAFPKLPKWTARIAYKIFNGKIQDGWRLVSQSQPEVALHYLPIWRADVAAQASLRTKSGHVATIYPSIRELYLPGIDLPKCRDVSLGIDPEHLHDIVPFSLEEILADEIRGKKPHVHAFRKAPVAVPPALASLLHAPIILGEGIERNSVKRSCREKRIETPAEWIKYELGLRKKVKGKAEDVGNAAIDTHSLASFGTFTPLMVPVYFAKWTAYFKQYGSGQDGQITYEGLVPAIGDITTTTETKAKDLKLYFEQLPLDYLDRLVSVYRILVRPFELVMRRRFVIGFWQVSLLFVVAPMTVLFPTWGYVGVAMPLLVIMLAYWLPRTIARTLGRLAVLVRNRASMREANGLMMPDRANLMQCNVCRQFYWTKLFCGGRLPRVTSVFRWSDQPQDLRKTLKEGINRSPPIQNAEIEFWSDNQKFISTDRDGMVRIRFAQTSPGAIVMELSSAISWVHGEVFTLARRAPSFLAPAKVSHWAEAPHIQRWSHWGQQHDDFFDHLKADLDLDPKRSLDQATVRQRLEEESGMTFLGSISRSSTTNIKK